MPKQSRHSAGLLMVRLGVPEFLLGKPGGPFFAKKDRGAWSIPKGLVEPEEPALAAACREFEEETGVKPGPGPFVELGQVRLKSGKRIDAWAFAGDADTEQLKSNLFELEWPPRSGVIKSYPEIEHFRFFDVGAAREHINPAQFALVERALAVLDQLGG